jgi:predicted ribosome quality control (RQC) complex YloA/Tae2 family protein
MSSFDVYVATSELNRFIPDSRIKNIYQLNGSTILLKLYKPNQQMQLLVEAGKRFHLTRYIHEKPSKPPTFCMALRKHLRNGKILEVTQHEFERIAILRIDTKAGEMQLVIELFGEGNIILVDPNNRILHALKFRKMRDRNIIRNEAFIYPPPSGKNPFKLKPEEALEIKSFGDVEVVRALTRCLSIGGIYAEEILERAGVEKTTPCKTLTQTEIDRIFKALNQILFKIRNGEIKPSIIMDQKGEYLDVTPICLRRYSQFKHLTYENFNLALDEFYTKTVTKEKISTLYEKLENEVARYKRILESQRKALEKTRKQREETRKIGDAIYLHMHELQQLINYILEEKKKGKTWEEIAAKIRKRKNMGEKPEVYFHSLIPKQQILTVRVEDLTFPLNLRKTIQENASSFYAKSKKAEKRLRGIISSIRKTEEKIKALQTKSTREITTAEKAKLLKTVKRQWYEKFRWFHSSEGFLIIGGRDATTNELLIKRYMEPADIVFHADIIGAPFVLIKTEGKTPTEQTLREAAQLAAAYSRAWKQKLPVLDVYWIKPEQISKQPPSGQYLTKGAFMIRGKKNYLRKTPVKTAIGIIKTEEIPKIIGGPASAIGKTANAYVEIVPNDLPAGKLAEKILKTLARKTRLEMSKQLQAFLVEEIRRFLPSGRGKILREDE